MIDLNFEPDKLNFEKGNGLIPAVIINEKDGNVLMLAYMNKEALEETLSRGRVVFFSRTKNRLWMKGEQSGNYLDVIRVSTDCDGDSLLIKTNPAGPVCHTGNISCFGELPKSLNFLCELEKIIASRKISGSDHSYTSYLFKMGPEYVCEKIMEESAETIQEIKNADKERFVEECSDLIYHLLVGCNLMGVSLEQICALLESRNMKKQVLL